MQTITLPEELREAVNSAFGNELNRRIGKGQVDAILTYESDGADTQAYVLEFKTVDQIKPLELWKLIFRSGQGPESWTFSGKCSKEDAENPVELRPISEDQARAAANFLGMSNYSLLLYPSQPGELDERKVRVELSPLGSQSVYMALEALLGQGDTVAMERGDIFHSKGTSRGTEEPDGSVSREAARPASE